MNYQKILYWSKIIGPLLLSIPFLTGWIKLHQTKPTSEALGITIITVGWWMFETFPLAVTSFIPLVLLPLFKISNGNKAASTMFNDTVLVMLSGFFISSSLIKSNLQSRIALKTVITIGFKPSTFLFSVCVITYFISMWISNTSTCLAMVPNVVSVFIKLEELGNSKESCSLFAKAVLMGITLSSTFGGMSTLVGTPPNLIFVQMYKNSFPTAPDISFGKYFLTSFPMTIVLFVIMFYILKKYYLSNIELKEIPIEDLEISYKNLGPMTIKEKFVAFIFGILAFLWFFKSNLEFGQFVIPGWTTLLLGKKGNDYVKDGTVGIFMTIFLFVVEFNVKKNENEKVILSDLIVEEKNENIQKDSSGPILTWEYAMENTRWDILILTGGGFVLNLGFQDSGLDFFIGQKLSFFLNCNIYFLVIMF